MKKNMGAADRVIRILIAIAIAVLAIAGVIRGTLAIVLGIVAVVFLLTSLVGSCPGYIPLGISTCRKPPSAPAA